MAHTAATAAPSPLRAITVRLSSTPAKQLPHIASFLANDISRCTAELSLPSSQSKNGSESAVLVHKLKIQISSLLQGKHVEEKWSAVVLVKAAVEAGGWEVLQSSGPWVRGMLAILGRSDPGATKQLCILTLTRIFSLAHGQQSLTREIVTPSLPAFFNHCLQAITREAAREDTKQVDAQSSLLDTVLQAFAHIIPHHPSASRPFVSQIKTLLAPLLAPTPSNHQPKGSSSFKQPSVSRSSSVLAQQLYALLAICAPKSTAGDEYSKSVRALVTHIHRTADHVFRAVVEEVRPQTSTVAPGAFDEIASDKWDDEFSLPRWRGIHAGAERLAGLMRFLHAYISTSSAMPYNLPVGSIWHCVERLLGVVGPIYPIYRDKIGQLAHNPEIDRDEREGLWSMLPLVHVEAVETISVLMSRLGLRSGSISSVAMSQLIWSYKACGSEKRARRSIYSALFQILVLFGPSTSHATVKTLFPLIRTCCEDVLPTVPAQASLKVTTSPGVNKQSNSVDNADSYLNPSIAKDSVHSECGELRTAALDLLPLFLSKLPTQHIPSSIRNEIDRTAILVNHKETMLASVLNPPQKRSRGKGVESIMPFVARAYPNAVEVEILLRPRMPVIPSRKPGEDKTNSDDEGSPDRIHETMTMDQGFRAEPTSSNFYRSYDLSQIQATSLQRPSSPEEKNSPSRDIDTNHQPTTIQNEGSVPQNPVSSKRPRTSSPPSSDDRPSAKPPSKRANINPLAPHLSSLPPVTVTEDKVFLDRDADPVPKNIENSAQDSHVTDPQLQDQERPTADEDVNETIEEGSADPIAALDKGKGKAVVTNDDSDDEEEGGGELERGQREGSFIGSETPEFNAELNPALFEDSSEEEDEV